MQSLRKKAQDSWNGSTTLRNRSPEETAEMSDLWEEVADEPAICSLLFVLINSSKITLDTLII